MKTKLEDVYRCRDLLGSPAPEIVKELCEEILRLRHIIFEAQDLCQDIQKSNKASIGAIENTYTPQLDVDRIDKLCKVFGDL